jgi:hypothetical protein
LAVSTGGRREVEGLPTHIGYRVRIEKVNRELLARGE